VDIGDDDVHCFVCILYEKRNEVVYLWHFYKNCLVFRPAVLFFM